MLLALSAQPAPAQTYVDRRVTAIPAGVLVSRDPASLVDPRRQKAGEQLDWDRRTLFFVWALSQVLALAVLWRSGNAARLRDALTRSLRSPVLVRFVFGASVATVAALASLPASILRYHTETIYDLNHQPVFAWIAQNVGLWFLVALAFGALTAFIYTLVARTRLWYVYTIVGLFAFVIGVGFVEPVAILPLFDRVHAAGRSAVIVALERRAGAADVPIVVDERAQRSTLAIAAVIGYGPTKRIVLSDALIAESTSGEFAFVVARALGHYLLTDPLKLALMRTLAFIIAIALGATIADRVGFRRDDDALSRLPLVTALMGVAALVLLPAYNAYARGIEARADRFAVALTGDPASAVRYYVRLADENLTPFCAPALERAYFLDFPPLGSRAAAALRRPDPCV